MVPTWTLLAALTAGLILGALGSRLFLRSPSPPAVMAALPPQEPMPQEAVVAEPEPAPPPAAAPAPPPEPLRISMEDVVSELERRYQGRQADASAEKQRSPGRRRRTR